MKQSAFAELCGVSPMMISKYKALGLVVLRGGEVDVAESLSRMEGRLDEDKRRRALTAMVEMGIAAPSAHAVRDAAPTARSAKAEKDEVDLALRRLEYGRQAGELVEAAEVADRAAEAVASFRESLANGRRETADRICAEFGLPSERAAQLAQFLRRRDEEALGRFAAVMTALAVESQSAEAVA